MIKSTMLKKPNIVVIFTLTSLIFLSSCGESMKQTLGISRPSPDEFTVITHEPLKTPRNFALVSPQSKRVRYVSNSQKNKQILFKNPLTEETYNNRGDNYLKQELAISPEDRVARELINQENDERLANKPEKTFLQKLMRLSGDEIDEDPIIDPILEKERILREQNQGGVVSGSEAEVRDPSDDDRGIFNRFLGL